LSFAVAEVCSSWSTFLLFSFLFFFFFACRGKKRSLTNQTIKKSRKIFRFKNPVDRDDRCTAQSGETVFTPTTTRLFDSNGIRSVIVCVQLRIVLPSCIYRDELRLSLPASRVLDSSILSPYRGSDDQHNNAQLVLCR